MSQEVLVVRSSFVDAWRLLMFVSTNTPLAWLVVNSVRPDCVEPRVIKSRGDKYKLLMKPRRQLRQKLERHSLAG